MSSKPIDPQLAAQVVALLNEAFALDPEAINALVNTRVRCNEALGEHPTIQCGIDAEGHTTIGLLGILNGLVGVDDVGYGAVAAVNQLDAGVWTVQSFAVKL